MMAKIEICLFFICLHLPPCIFAQTQKLPLDGIWKFKALDAEGKTVQSGTIKVPGIWEAQGYGKPTGILKHHHHGVGRYETEFTAPDSWRDKDVFFVIGGVSRYAKVWIDGNIIGGEAVGFLGSHRWDVSKHAVPGKKSSIRIDVDSRQRMEIDALMGTAQLNDFMLTPWGGLFGHVYFEAKPKNRIDQIYVSTKVFPVPSVSATVDLHGSGLSGSSIEIEVSDADERLLGRASKPVPKNSESQKVSCRVPEAKLWSPESPNLCFVKIRLARDGATLDEHTVRTGIREIKIDGCKMFINGRPLYLRGYGDDHIYLDHIAMPADKKLYLDRLKRIKSMGFNHVRHHSTIMPPEYYEACDEVGIMPNAEFPISYPPQFPGSRTWKKTVKNGDEKASLRLYAERFECAVRELRNYACIFAWCGGNEIFMMDKEGISRKHPLFDEFRKIVERLDPSRPFVDTDGEWYHYILNPKNDRKNLDVYYVLFDEWKTVFQFPKKYDTRKYSDGMPPLKPVLSHETGNFTTFARPSVISSFKDSPFKPFWLEGGAAELKRRGLSDEAEKWAEASERHFVFLHKYNIEEIRKNPDISGYHFWLIQDYWTSTDGIFDVAFNMKKGIDAGEIIKFNSPAVALQSNFKGVYASGESFASEISVSNYSENAVKGRFKIRLSKGGREICQTDVNAQIECGQIAKICRLEAPTLPSVSEPGPIELSVISHDGKIRNNWHAWLFPKKTVPKCEGSIYADSEALKSLPEYWNAEKIPDGKLSEKAVYAVSKLTKPVCEALLAGARVVLLDGSQLSSSRKITYKSSWWRAGGSEKNNQTGTYVCDNPITRQFAPDNWCDRGWLKLIENGTTYDIDSIKGADNYIRTLTSLLSLRHMSMLYGLKTGKGYLVVSGLNHSSVRNEPENAWLLSQMATAKLDSKTDCGKQMLSKLKFEARP